MALIGIELAKEFKTTTLKPSTKIEGIEEFDDGEELHNTKGIVFIEKP